MTEFLQRKGSYNPDVLSCLANLSNDEVFTPPAIVNRMLDLLPPDIFRDPGAKFLDPACKTGVFLREIAKRLMAGLTEAIPDENKRREHIFKKQLFGIAITELTALMSRRSVYCSKDASCRYSVVRFASPAGNIRFKRIRHAWESGRCKYCGASQQANDRDASLESHAYEFIHTLKPEEIFNMHFDVVIGNPPYQLEDGGFGISASPIYDRFVESAKKLMPRFIVMIIPARWYAGGKGLDEFRDEMLHDTSLRIIHDYPNADECFNGVQIKGGIMYFLWTRDSKGDCSVYTHHKSVVYGPVSRPLLEQGSDTFIRFNEGVEIYRKVKKFNEPTMEGLVSSRKPFGLSTTFHGRARPSRGDIVVYENQGVSYASREEICVNRELVDQFKVFIPRSSSGSDAFPHPILGKPFVGRPGTACSETYITIGPFENEEVCKNVISYIKTRFMRTLAMFKKVTQSTTRALYTFVPVQDFSRPWTDKELYEKYGLTAEEIAFIESMVSPMDAGE